jgi:lysophospholipase L1-like esterase
LAALVWAAATARAAEGPGGLLKPGLHLAIAGDSITEQKQYSRYLELYLTACTPELNASVCQFGWGGETAGGFAGRMDNDLRDFAPTVVTLCYGMNDGGYRAYEPSIGQNYEKAMRSIVGRLVSNGVTVVVGGPGVVDSKYFVRTAPAVYNANLAQLSAIAAAIAGDHSMPHADVHGAMMSAMEKAKATLGADYDVGGGDGVHPRANGQLVMAYAFLKAMGLDGNLGSIALDLKGASSAAGGHKVLSSAGGRVELESTRYPFCTYGGARSSDGTRSILPFVPFDTDLNRLTLTVKGLDTERARITWGNVSNEFSRADLEQGVNLAAAFPDNPFSEPFRRLDEAVLAKQSYETLIVKSVITVMPRLQAAIEEDAEAAAAMKLLRRKLWDRQAALAAQVRAALVPVKHILTVEPLK